MHLYQAQRFPFTAFPSGIYAVAFSNEIKPTERITFPFMQKQVTVTRTATGELIVTPDFPMFEQYGLIFLKHGSQDSIFPDWNQTAWGQPIQHYFKIRSHPQEILENTVDKSHFYSVHHYANVTELHPMKITGPELEVAYQLERRESIFGWLDKRKTIMRLAIHVYGLGLSSVEVLLPQYGLIAKQIVCPTPIDGEYIHVRAITSIQIPTNPRWLPGKFKKYFANYLTKIAAKGFLKDFLPDLNIWQHKKYLTQPHYLPNDGEFERYRAWATQFYPSLSDSDPFLHG